MQDHVLELRRAEASLDCALRTLERVVAGRLGKRHEEDALDARSLGSIDDGDLPRPIDALDAVGARVVWESAGRRHDDFGARETLNEGRRLLDVARVTAHAVRFELRPRSRSRSAPHERADALAACPESSANPATERSRCSHDNHVPLARVSHSSAGFTTRDLVAWSRAGARSPSEPCTRAASRRTSPCRSRST